MSIIQRVIALVKIEKVAFPSFFLEFCPLFSYYMIWLPVLEFITIYGGRVFSHIENRRRTSFVRGLRLRLTRLSATDIIKRKIKKHGAAACSAAPCMFVQKEFLYDS